MNATQQKYLRQRLQSLMYDKKNKIPHNRHYGYSLEVKKNLYDEGKYSVVFKNGNFNIVWEGEEESRKEYDKQTSAIDAEYNRVLDHIMFTGVEEVAELIAAFEKFEV